MLYQKPYSHRRIQNKCNMTQRTSLKSCQNKSRLTFKSGELRLSVGLCLWAPIMQSPFFGGRLDRDTTVLERHTNQHNTHKPVVSQKTRRPPPRMRDPSYKASITTVYGLPRARKRRATAVHSEFAYTVLGLGACRALGSYVFGAVKIKFKSRQLPQNPLNPPNPKPYTRRLGQSAPSSKIPTHCIP